MSSTAAHKPAKRVAGGTRSLHLTNPHLSGDDVRQAQELLATNPYGGFSPGDGGRRVRSHQRSRDEAGEMAARLPGEGL